MAHNSDYTKLVVKSDGSYSVLIENTSIQSDRFKSDFKKQEQNQTYLSRVINDLFK